MDAKNHPAKTTQRTHTGLVTRAMSFVPASLDPEARTVRVLWSTGATRRDWSWEDGDVDEALSLDGVDLSAWDGAAVRDSHDYSSIMSQLGVIVPGSTVRTTDGMESTVRFARTDWGQAALDLVADAVANQWSVGYDQIIYDRTPAALRSDGGTVPLYTAVSWRPRELSLVVNSADTGVRTRSADDHISITVLEQVMDTKNAPTTTPAPASGAVTETVDLEATRAAAVLEYTERVSAIRTAAQVLGFGGDVIDPEKLGMSKRSLDEIRTELIGRKAAEQAKTAVSGVHYEAGVDATEKRAQAMVASLLRRANPGVKAFREAPGANEYRGTLIDMVRDELAVRGLNVRGMSPSQIAEAALRHGGMAQRSGPSMTSADLPSVFLDAANKSLNVRYLAVPRHYRNWATQSNFRDFRPHKYIKLSGLSRPPKKIEGEKFAQVAFSDAREQASLDTYGYEWKLTRQMIVNDDLDAFSSAPVAVADSFADNENYVMYSVFSDNPYLQDGNPLFDANHGNILGSFGKPGSTIAKALSLHTWETLEGSTRGYMYGHVIVPQAYGWDAQIYYGEQWASTQSSAVRPEMASGKIITVSDYLPTGAWYTAAPNSGVMYGHLDGEEGVTVIEEPRTDADSISFFARSDFSAAIRDHVGLVKIFETDPDA